jgi:hypothetical protein
LSELAADGSDGTSAGSLGAVFLRKRAGISDWAASGAGIIVGDGVTDGDRNISFKFSFGFAAPGSSEGVSVTSGFFCIGTGTGLITGAGTGVTGSSTAAGGWLGTTDGSGGVTSVDSGEGTSSSSGTLGKDAGASVGRRKRPKKPPDLGF